MTVLTAQQVYAMLGSQSVWDTARRCQDIFADAGIPHAILGGLAVCLHGYQRNTVDVDILVKRDDSQAVRESLEGAGFRWNADNGEFRSPDGVPVHFLLANEPAGDERAALADARIPVERAAA